jgi:cephalosporin hydroxylase
MNNTNRKNLRNVIYERFFCNFISKRNIVDYFHKLYYDTGDKTWYKNTFWLGTRTWKCPLDLWVYQEIIFELKPDIIIECGTASGGSASFLAFICDALNKGKIISIDIAKKANRPQHKRIKYLSGSSTSQKIVEKVSSFIKSKNKIMVILDSDHHKDHVLKELAIYSKFVTKGSYIIVEDTNINGHPVEPAFGPGPMEAIKEFLKNNKNFAIDKSREKFYLTFNPNGYLKRIA